MRTHARTRAHTHTHTYTHTHAHTHQLLALCLRQPAPARGVQHRLVQLDPFLTGEAELLTLGDGWGGAGLGRGGLLQHFLYTHESAAALVRG
eukprot:1149475-Pelagomonas_calceolata.AAC.3